MPRPPRADEAGELYHAMNCGNLGSEIFCDAADYEAFELILAEGLQRCDVRLYAFQLMPKHWHLILRPNQDGEMSRFVRWITSTHTMRYHAHYGTLGEGHVYQGRFKSFPIQPDRHFSTVCRYVEQTALRAGLVDHAEDWRWGSLSRWMLQTESDPPLLSRWPIPRLPHWVHRVNEPLSDEELESVCLSAKRGRPFGKPDWVESTVKRLSLESTLRPRGRPRVRNVDE